MASESFILGVPYLLINPLKCGYIDYQVGNYPEFFCHSTKEKVINESIDKFLAMPFNDMAGHKDKIEVSTINPTDFLIWFVENYPESRSILKQDPECQYKFK